MAIPYLLRLPGNGTVTTSNVSLYFEMKLTILIVKGQVCTVIRMQCLIDRQGENLSWFDLRVLCLRA
jgi:hypothetical protein